MFPGMLSGYIQEWLGYTDSLFGLLGTWFPAITIAASVKYPRDFGKKQLNERFTSTIYEILEIRKHEITSSPLNLFETKIERKKPWTKLNKPLTFQTLSTY